MKKILSLFCIILIIAGCSNMLIDLTQTELDAGEKIVFTGTDGSMVVGTAVDADTDGAPDGIDVNGDGTADFKFIAADSSPSSGAYGVDTNGDGQTDLYITVSSTGASTLNTSADGTGTAMIVDVADDGTIRLESAETADSDTAETETETGTETHTIAATTDINGDGSIDAADTAILSKLTFTVTGDTVSITGADSSISGVLNIPASYDGKSVTSIANSALKDCSALTTVSIPEGVTYVGFQSFANCSSLTSISFPGSLTSLEPAAFEACTSLTTVTLPTGISAIYNSFTNCTALTSVTIPPNITTIGMSAFQDCSALTAVTIPASVTDISSGAFENCTGLTSLTMLPTSAPTAASDIFAGIPNPVSLTYPDGATGYDAAGTIWVDGSAVHKDGDVNGDGLIDGDDTTLAGKLDFTLDGEEYILSDVSDTSIAGSIFIPATYLGKPVTSIGDQAFSDCSSLTSIILPDSVASIGKWAFSRCTSLTSITIPAAITSIGDFAFLLSTALETFNISAAAAPATGDRIFYGITSAINIIAPDSAAGYDSSPWEEAEAGDLNGDLTVDSKDAVIFDKLTFTETSTEAVLTASDSSISDKLVLQSKFRGKPLTEIADSAFENRPLLKSVTIPASITTIEDNAFNNSTNIKALTMLSTTAPSLGSNVFDGITNSYLNIPSGATGYDVSPWNNSSMFRIAGDYNGDRVVDGTDTTIASCLTWDDEGSATEITLTGITDKELSGTLIIPNTHDGRTVTKLYGGDTLRECDQITSIVIPDGVTLIGGLSFFNWTSLESITLPSGKLAFQYGAFKGCSSLTSISLPSECWSLGANMFEDCSSLTSIIIPDGITTIKEYTFVGCSSLESVSLPDGLTTLETQAFYQCSSLTSMTIPESVVSIENDAFKSCTLLETINLPSGLTSISSQLFNACSSLTSIDIPAGVTAIGSSAFSACSKLTEVTIRATTAPTLGSSSFTGISEDRTLRIPTGATGYDVNPWNQTFYFDYVETF